MFEVLGRTEGKVTAFRMLKPDDWHQHMRDGDMLKLVGPMVSKRFYSAIIMPNLTPPITTAQQAFEYRQRILDATEPGFIPLMTLYLTDGLDPEEVRKSHNAVWAIKYYPRGLTTNSDSGVKNPADLWTPGTKPYDCLQVLAEQRGVLLLHAADGFDRAGAELDPYDQEKHFVMHTLPEIIKAHPRLKISVEHLSTKWGADFIVTHGGEYLGCSLTAHHLLLDRRDVFRGGFHPHRSWMPVIQPPEHKEALRHLATADKPFVWLGSDSAPHPRVKKEAACCASGVLMAHAGIELYAEAFEDMKALDNRFERFASLNGRKFFGFINDHMQTIELVREEWKSQPLFYAESGENLDVSELVPFRLGENIRWKLAA